MPRMRDVLLSTVFFVYHSDESAHNNSEEGATGFFFAEPSEVDPLHPHLYAVTNLHVKINAGEKLFLRINTEDGNFDILPTMRDDWFSYGNDIAICPIDLGDKNFSIAYFTKESIVNDEFIAKENVGAGDDVVMAGRFRHVAGINKNVPVLRFGNIASMEKTKIFNKGISKEQESFLVEMRSIPGFSGSPVVVYMDSTSIRWKKREALPPGPKTLKDFELPPYRERLLGINWGQIMGKMEAKNTVTGEKIIVDIDTAMAGIVPISQLIELIDSDKMIEMRRLKDEQIVKKGEESGWNTTS